jgi:DNA-binding protein Fis
MKISQKPSEKNTSEQGINVSAKPSLREWLRNNPGRSVNDYYSKFGI